MEECIPPRVVIEEGDNVPTADHADDLDCVRIIFHCCWGADHEQSVVRCTAAATWRRGVTYFTSRKKEKETAFVATTACEHCV
jgi:hypothetical protein